jgi:hypothetical protein
MKGYIFLYGSKSDSYLPLNKRLKNDPLSLLFSMLFGDFRPWDNDFLNHTVNFYNAHFIYHDLEKNFLYIGFGDWLIDSEIDGPSDEEFPYYVNESNSCKMSVDNFIEFRKQWAALRQPLWPFAIIYRDEHDWVDCKGFHSKDEMEQFVKNYEPQILN